MTGRVLVSDEETRSSSYSPARGFSAALDRLGRWRLIDRLENKLVFIAIGERNQEQHPSRLREEPDHAQVSICILEIARAGELLHPAWKHPGRLEAELAP